MFKKILAIVFSVILAAAFSGCSENEGHFQKTDGNGDYFESNVIWDRDAQNHWRVGENGEKINIAPHELDDGAACTVCKSEITDWGDGAIDVTDYNVYNDQIRQTSYDADGNVAYERTAEYEYDENGSYKFIRIFDNGVLYSECEYTVTDEGYCYPLREHIYSEDGGYDINEYDENGNVCKVTGYDENGEIWLEAVMEYSLDADGWYYESKNTQTYYPENVKYVYQYNEYGDIICYKEYDAEDSIVSEEAYTYGYDDEGRMTYKALTANGVLSEEIHFGIHEEEDGWWTYYEKQIIYYDGGYTVYEFNENEELISETDYDSEGNVK